MEFDLVILCRKTGKLAFIEINGGSHVNEYADDRDSRVDFMRNAGYVVRHFTHHDWKFDNNSEMINWAKECIKEVLASVERSVNIRKLPCWEDYND